MRRVLMLLPLLLFACVEDPPGSTVAMPPPGAIAASVPPVSAANLSGQWVFGDGTEPAPGPVVTCEPAQTLTLYQQGGSLHGDVKTCSRPCTTPADCEDACKTLEAFEGVNSDGTVTLKGKFSGNQLDRAEDVEYALRFDPQTRHLVGTRDGRAFWAAPWGRPIGRRCSD